MKEIKLLESLTGKKVKLKETVVSEEKIEFVQDLIHEEGYNSLAQHTIYHICTAITNTNYVSNAPSAGEEFERFADYAIDIIDNVMKAISSGRVSEEEVGQYGFAELYSLN